MKYEAIHLERLNNYRFRHIGIKINYKGTRIEVRSQADFNSVLSNPINKTEVRQAQSC